MMNGLKSIKLGLLGVVSAVIPVLFIFQADKIASQNEAFIEQKIRAAKLVVIDSMQKKQITFYESELAKRNPCDGENGGIIFNPTIIVSKEDEGKKEFQSMKWLEDQILDLRNKAIPLIAKIDGLKDSIKNENESNRSELGQLSEKVKAISDSISDLNKKVDDLNHKIKYPPKQDLPLLELRFNPPRLSD